MMPIRFDSIGRPRVSILERRFFEFKLKCIRIVRERRIDDGVRE